MAAGFLTGLDLLASDQAPLLAGRRVGLLTHPAAVTARGVHAAQALRKAGANVTALFGPEHGYTGSGGAGDHVPDAKHPAWGIPIHSLYGNQRRPTDAMLADVDVLVVDLQDLAVRCYTYITTLRYVLEEAARAKKSVIVCDRPVPFPATLDGPMLEAGHESFVAGVNVPLVYGMTPGEAAAWLKQELKLDLDLNVVSMRGYKRDPKRPAKLPWIPPSPGIRSWETAWCYPATVLFEALPAVDFGRGTPHPFQVLTAPWIDAEKLARKLHFDGATAQPHWGNHPGIRLVVTNPSRFRPVAAGVQIVQALGPDAWNEAREEWFDKLMGTDRVRAALKSGTPWKDIVASWQPDLATFAELQKPHLLY